MRLNCNCWPAVIAWKWIRFQKRVFFFAFLQLVQEFKASVQNKKADSLIELNSNEVSLFETSQRILLTEDEFAEKLITTVSSAVTDYKTTYHPKIWTKYFSRSLFRFPRDPLIYATLTHLILTASIELTSYDPLKSPASFACSHAEKRKLLSNSVAFSSGSNKFTRYASNLLNVIVPRLDIIC